MTTSSARPDNLDAFVTSASGLDPALAAEVARFASAYQRFAEQPNELATATATNGSDPPRLEEFGPTRALADQYLIDVGWEATFVAAVAKGFRDKDAGGIGVRTIDDADLVTSLQAAGLPAIAIPQPHDVPTPDAAGLTVSSGFTDDPVNAASGNFVEHEVDLVAPDRLRMLQWDRVYNSRFRDPGPLGRGWSSWATARLDPDEGGVTYHGPDGQQVRIPRDETGSFAVPPTLAAALRVGSANGYELAWLDGQVWTYDRRGHLLAVALGSADVTRFERDRQDRLVSLDHSTGTSIALRWTDDRIVAVTGIDGADVEYRYDEAGDLIEAAGPAGRRRYELGPAGLIAALIDGDGVELARNTYDDLGRVTTQLSPHGRLTRFTHLPGPATVVDDSAGGSRAVLYHDASGRLTGALDANGHRFAKVLDGQGNPTRIIDRRGDETAQEFDDAGRCIRRIDADGSEWRFEWDDQGRSTAVIGPNGATTTCQYEGDQRWPAQVVDPLGAVTRFEVVDDLVHRVVDADGVPLVFEYDDRQQVVAIVNGLGHRQTIERDGVGRVVAVTRPSGAVTRFGYDEVGNVTDRIDADGSRWQFTWTPGGRPLAVIEPDGATTAWTYGAHGDVTHQIDPAGAVTELLQDVLGNLVGIVGPDGARWQLDYDGLCQLVAVHDPTGAVEQRDYDPEGALVGVTDPLGHRASLEIDAVAHTTRRTDPSGGMSVLKTDALGRPVERVGPDGATVTNTYDLAGRLVAVTGPTGAVERFEHSAAGRLVRRISPLGHVTTYEYDEAAQLIGEVGPTGARTRLRRDADGLVTRVEHPTGEVERLLHDRLGRMVEHHAPDGGVTRWSYDHRGSVTAVTDPTGATRRFTYDARGALLTATDALGGTTSYEYDEAGRPIATTDPLGAVTRLERDRLGRVIAQVDPLGRRTELAYDAAGRLVSRTLPTGEVVTYAYDATGRVVGMRGGDLTTIIERDAAGRPVHVMARDLEVFLRYDAAGRLIARDDGTLALAWHYDDDGNRTAVVLPDGSEITYRFDPVGRLAAVAHPRAGEAVFERDALGRVVDYRDPQNHRSWAYVGGRLLAYTRRRNGAVETTTLEHDRAGRVTRARGSKVNNVEFGYDEAGQLRSWTGPAGTATFDYDAGGRLVGEQCPDGTDVGHRYDAAGQLLERVAGDDRTELEYDAAGRRIAERSARGSRSYRWDGFGRLSAITESAVGPAPIEPAARTTDLAYDPLGDLARVGDTPLLWDPVSVIPQVRMLGDRAVVGDVDPLALIGLGSAASVGSGGPAEGEWVDRNWHGDVIGMSAAAGFAPSPFDPWGASQESPATPAEPTLGYRGELALGIGDLIGLRNRVYDAGARSFLSVDPLGPVPGSPTASTPYHYAGNDPVNHVDPLGLRPLTQAQYQEFRDKQRTGVIVGGLTTLAGAALCFAPFPGAQILGGAVMSAGINMVSQGTWPPDMKQVAVAGVVGAVGGGAFSLATAGGANMAVAGAFSGFEASMTNEAFSVADGHPFNPKAVVFGTAFGGALGYGGGKLASRFGGGAAGEGRAAAAAGEVPSGRPTPAQVALDSSSARALTSADQSVGRRLLSQLDGHDLVMSQSAVDEYQTALARLAGPQEKAASEALMARVTVVPDNPSARVAGLKITKRVNVEDIPVFGTADEMGIPIATSDLSFLRGANAQGVTLDAIVHPSKSFKGW